MGGTERLLEVDASTADDLRGLWSRAAEADGVGAVSEAFRLAVGRSARASSTSSAATDDGAPSSGTRRSPRPGPPTPWPSSSSTPATAAPGTAAPSSTRPSAEGARSVWSHGLLPAAEALASAAGLSLTRSLHRMTPPAHR